MKVVVDTNLLIYLLNGDERVADFLNDLQCLVSAITELELFNKKDLKEQEIDAIEDLIESCELVEVLPDIRILAKQLILKYHIRLPDALIAATAIHQDLPFLTADKHFTPITELQLFLIQF
jgi:predicted nucleic acid-binding protein